MFKNGLKLLGVLIVYCVLLINNANALENIKQIVCLGDETTKGMWREEMIGNGTRWVDILASYDNNIEVINAGIDGMTAGNVGYLNNILTEYPNADMYIIYLGINDIKKIRAIDPAAVASVGAKILRMVRTIKQKSPKAEITIIAPQRIYAEKASEDEIKDGVDEHTQVLSEMIDGSLGVVAERENVRFIELIDQIKPEMLADGVKPNIAGHAKIAEIVWDEISHPFIKANSNHIAQTNMAPPPVGTPEINTDGTISLINSISEDAEELKGMGSKVEYTEKKDVIRARAKNYINEEQAKKIVTKNAYDLGNDVSKSIIKTAEKILIHNVDKAMETQFISAYNDKENVSEINYQLPEPSRVESYITTVEAKDDKEYENLSDVVDWDQVKLEEDKILIENNKVAIINDKEEVTADTSNETINIAEAAGKDIIEDNVEITEVWLPELEIGVEDTSKQAKVNEAVELANLDIAENKSNEIMDNEIKEVFAESEKIEYTGYEVLIHTGIYE